MKVLIVTWTSNVGGSTDSKRRFEEISDMFEFAIELMKETHDKKEVKSQNIYMGEDSFLHSSADCTGTRHYIHVIANLGGE